MAGYRITKVGTLYDGWRKVLGFTVRKSDGETMEREIVESDDVAAVLPYDPQRRTVVLVRQFRVPVMHIEAKPDILEVIAGLLEGDEPEACARREAMEEAGLRLGTLEPVGCTWSTPGAMTERLNLFLAPYTAADRVAEGGGLAEEHEDIEVLEIGCGELARMLEQNAVTDLKTLALTQALRIRHPELFETA
ncbi:NUDIX domain-containing protein [Microvirga lenta]|uniref:NUDIX domain-containing protein n=1 Tax=Microvirga lenta TaxID=2881337 RepID=UPI001CFFD198|nr:NUDIX domain-containing protein [Microvirga lenta]MCB5174895.1 NUDIX domain-containing protein [Microvirga lenta]